MMEKVGKSNTGDSTKAISLRCFLKHKLKNPKGKEEEGASFIIFYLRTESSDFDKI
jgi:hypothetical protein